MSTPLQFFDYHKGNLSSEGVSMFQIAAEVETPVYVYNSQALLEPLQQLKKGLQGLDHLICFALKSNSNIAILKLLSEAGAGMDVVSGGELHRATKAGVAAQKIVFSGVGKTPMEMIQALHLEGTGILSFNVESVPELSSLNQLAIARKCKARVALRFNPDVDAKTHPYISTGLKENKFGMEKAEILEVLQNSDQFPGIEFKGLSIHIGSQLLSLSPLNDAFTRLRALVNEVNSFLPVPLDQIDLGGGIGITYHREKTPSLEKYCALIQRHFGPKARLKRPVKVLIEPGRTISGNSGLLLTQVLYRKKRDKRDFLVVDAAMNDLIRPSLYGSYHEIVPVEHWHTEGKTRKTDVVGPVCESADCFASNRPLPHTLYEGDLLAILSAGAYGFTMASNYNSRPRPAEVLIHKGRYHVIRDREKFEDLVQGERFLEET